MTTYRIQVEFSDDERAWIARCDDQPSGRWIVRYARAINTLAVAPLASGLASEVTYESQSVFDRMVGQDRLLTYWRDKFDTIRGSGRALAAELSRLPDGQPCAALYQAASEYDANWLDTPLAVMTIKTNAIGEAESFFMITCVPEPASAHGSGIFPGRTQPPAAHPKRFVRTSSAFDEVTLCVFYLDGAIGLDREMVEAVARVREQLPGIRVVESSFENADRSPGWSAVHQFGFNGFPSVGALFKGRPIYRHQGVIAGERLVAALREAAPLFVVSPGGQDGGEHA
jgi:hypothetical protein